MINRSERISMFMNMLGMVLLAGIGYCWGIPCLMVDVNEQTWPIGWCLRIETYLRVWPQAVMLSFSQVIKIDLTRHYLRRMMTHLLSFDSATRCNLPQMDRVQTNPRAVSRRIRVDVL